MRAAIPPSPQQVCAICSDPTHPMELFPSTMQASSTRPIHHQGQPSSEPKKPALEDLIAPFEQTSQQNQNTMQASINKLETQGTFPSQPEINPRNSKHAKAIRTLRSGKSYGPQENGAPNAGHAEDHVKKSGEDVDITSNKPKIVLPTSSITATTKKPKEESYTPSLPFPHHVHKQRKDQHMFDILDACTNKRIFSPHEKVLLTEECSAMLLKKLPPKLKDPGSIGKLKSTSVSLQLADRSVTYSKGIIEDMLIKVKQFVLPADFLVLNMEEDRDIPLLLGHPFLATTGDLEECNSIDIVETLAHANFLANSTDDLLQIFLANLELQPATEEEALDIRHEVESLGSLIARIVPSIKKAPKLELKLLPEHLKYAYLGENDTLPIIIVATLTSIEEKKLLRVLREFKSVLGWTIANIKGISPSICMHKILLEENSKPIVEAQRRLNPNMKEVV
ncbi:unnamed protein product [Prunus armeniaca]